MPTSRRKRRRFRLTRVFPSMYQRRLLLVAGGALFALGLPLIQATRLTVVQGDELRADAEKRLVNEKWIRTIRGTITDRKGRVLAVDKASFDVAIDYPVITGRWAYTQAAQRARRLNPDWNELAPEERNDRILRHVPEFQTRLEQMWETISMVAGVPRAELEEKRLAVIDQVRNLAASVTEAQRKALERELNKGAELFGDDRDAVEVRTGEVKRRIAEEEAAHVILADVPDVVGFKIRQLAQSLVEETGPGGGGGAPIALLPGVHVIDSVSREYPLESMDVPVDGAKLPGPLRRDGYSTVRVHGVATHVLGWVRSRVTREDIERRERERLQRAGVSSAAPALTTNDLGPDRGRYFPTDPVGAFGIEYASEFDLRGTRGVQTTHLETGKVDTAEPQNGRALTLTLDAALQARVQALFDPSRGLAIAQPWQRPTRADTEEAAKKPQDLPLGTPLNGAAVVLDIATGDILAMVSVPTFTREDLKTRPKDYWEDKYLTPYINRATFKWYTPGSIVKPLILCAATNAGKLHRGEHIDCTGHFFPDKPDLYRCWIYKQYHTTHNDRFGHAPDGADAVCGSCNIFFFELGRRLGQKGITDWYSAYGVGAGAERWNLGTGQESPGTIPKDLTKMDLSEAILMGIGQGPVAWTPLHAADAYATLARGGKRIIPRMRVDAPVRTADLQLDSFAVKQGLDGLYRSASTAEGTTFTVRYGEGYGAERIFSVPGITVWAKSGTADVAPFKADLGAHGASGGGGPAVYDGDHAWTVCLAGVGRPEYAVAVVVDHGGSGGKCAGPIANQVVHALVAEGYLPNLSGTPNADTDQVDAASY